VYARRWHDRRLLLAHGSLGALCSQGGFHIAYARKIEIEMRPAIFISILRESHLRFPKQQQQAAREPQRGSPNGVRKPPDEAMTILELLSLHLSVDGLVNAIACDQRFQKTPSPKRLKDMARHRDRAPSGARFERQLLAHRVGWRGAATGPELR
jgi:hypothetical protein